MRLCLLAFWCQDLARFLSPLLGEELDRLGLDKAEFWSNVARVDRDAEAFSRLCKNLADQIRSAPPKDFN